jgi:hypothetical protein
MRSIIRAVLVAVALVFAVPVLPALAQKAPTVQVSWTTVTMKDVPLKVREAQKRAYPHVKVTKYERGGTGSTAVYRLTMTGKHKDATFTAAGKQLAPSK